jgi:hypothetical protein
MDELLDELPRPASLGAAPELIRPVGDKPARGLTRRETSEVGAKVTEEDVRERRWIDAVGRIVRA